MKDADFEKTMDNWVAHEVESAPELRPTQEIYRMLEEKRSRSPFPVFARRILVGLAAFCLLLTVAIPTIILNFKSRDTIIALRSGYEADKTIVKNIPKRDDKKGSKMATPTFRQLMFQYQKAESESIYGIDLRFPMEEEVSLNAEDNYRLIVQSYADKYIYVFQLNSSGKMTRLFPNSTYSYEQNPLKQEISYYIPSEPDWLYVTGKAGKESIYIIASKEPISDLGDLYDQYDKTRFRGEKQKNLLLLLDQIENIGSDREEANKWVFIFENNGAK